MPSLVPTDSTHLLTLSEAWDPEEKTKMAPAKWRVCVELQLYSEFTDCIELQRLTIWLLICRCLANLHAQKCATSAMGNNLTKNAQARLTRTL